MTTNTKIYLFKSKYKGEQRVAKALNKNSVLYFWDTLKDNI